MRLLFLGGGLSTIGYGDSTTSGELDWEARPVEIVEEGSSDDDDENNLETASSSSSQKGANIDGGRDPNIMMIPINISLNSKTK